MVARRFGRFGCLVTASLFGCQLPAALPLDGGAGSTNGGSSGASSSGVTASSGSTGGTTTGSGGGSTSSGSGGSSQGPASDPPYGSDQSTEYRPCSSSAQCTPPETCASLNGVSLCLIPCSSYQGCHDDETCTLSYCIPNFCGPGGTNSGSYYGRCTATDGSSGICVPYVDPETYPPQTTGICFAAGTQPLGADCAPNLQAEWGVPPGALCAPPGLCAPSEDGGVCTQACDPSGTFDAGCPASANCMQVPDYTDKYLGLCQ